MYPPYNDQTPFEYIVGVIVASLILMALVVTFAGALDKDYEFQRAVYNQDR